MSASAHGSPGPALAERIAEQARRLEAHTDPALRAPALELLQAVMEMHALALERVLACIEEQGERGEPVLEAMLRDPAVSSLLLLHELHPHSLERRVETALEELRPQLQGARIELLAIESNRVRLRFVPAPGVAAEALQSRIAGRLADAAPDASIELESGGGDAGFVPLSALLRPAAAKP